MDMGKIRQFQMIVPEEQLEEILQYFGSQSPHKIIWFRTDGYETRYALNGDMVPESAVMGRGDSLLSKVYFSAPGMRIIGSCYSEAENDLIEVLKKDFGLSVAGIHKMLFW